MNYGASYASPGEAVDVTAHQHLPRALHVLTLAGLAFVWMIASPALVQADQLFVSEVVASASSPFPSLVLDSLGDPHIALGSIDHGLSYAERVDGVWNTTFVEEATNFEFGAVFPTIRIASDGRTRIAY